MARAKPIIVTNWGGQTDFMHQDSRNSTRRHGTGRHGSDGNDRNDGNATIGAGYTPNVQNSFALNYSLVPVPFAVWVDDNWQRQYDFGVWADAHASHLKSLMQHVVDQTASRTGYISSGSGSKTVETHMDMNQGTELSDWNEPDLDELALMSLRAARDVARCCSHDSVGRTMMELLRSAEASFTDQGPGNEKRWGGQQGGKVKAEASQLFQAQKNGGRVRERWENVRGVVEAMELWEDGLVSVQRILSASTKDSTPVTARPGGIAHALGSGVLWKFRAALEKLEIGAQAKDMVSSPSGSFRISERSRN